MKVKYFEDTDTLYISLSSKEPTETKEFNENLFLELDSDGHVVALTVEHAKNMQGKLDFSYETITA